MTRTYIYIAFLIWFCAPEIHAIGTDLPQAIKELSIDTYDKTILIQEWEENELKLMQYYFNNISIECQEYETWNIETVEALINETSSHHNQQMLKLSLDSLYVISEFWTAKLTKYLSDAEFQAYVGETEAVMNEIQDKIEQGLDLISDIKDAVDTMADSLCIALTVPLALCGGGVCAGIGGGLCATTQYLTDKIKDELVKVAENYAELSETAVAPEVQAGIYIHVLIVIHDIIQSIQYIFRYKFTTKKQ